MSPLRAIASFQFIAVAALALLFSGCANSGPELVTVRGKVTNGGGSWPKPGVIYFTPVEAAPGLPLRPAIGYFKEDGAFEVTSFSSGDGLIPGTYQAHVEVWEVEPDPAVGMGKSFVPPKYRNPMESGFKLVIPSGSDDVEVVYDVPK